MFVQTVLEEIKIKAEYPTFRFLFMFAGVVGAALLATDMRADGGAAQPNPIWFAVALLLLSGLALGGERIWRKTTQLLPVRANRRT